MSRLSQDHTGIFRLFLVAVLAAMVAATSGCAERDPTASKIKVSLPEYTSGHLIKTVAILPFTNRSNISDETAITDWYQPFVAGLKEACSGVRILAPDDDQYPELLRSVNIDAEGRVDGAQIAEVGRALGLNTVITGTLYPVHFYTKTKGFWIFRDAHHYARTNANISAYSVETGAKRFDEIFKNEMEIENTGIELDNQKDQSVIENAPELLGGIVASAVDRTGDMIDDTYWVGFVTGNASGRVVISAGSESGLQAGQVFDVYRNDATIAGRDGSLMRIPGVKIGELEIVAVRAGRSEAVSRGEHPVPVGAAVRLQP